MVKILNTMGEDYHMHSINYSDGMNTIDEIVQYAGKIGLKKITITDHSQFMLDGK
jgi:histidinol phosphatase-like PHP family hydrolase